MCYNSAWGEQTCHDYKINPQIRNLGVLNLRYCRAVSALHSPALVTLCIVCAEGLCVGHVYAYMCICVCICCKSHSFCFFRIKKSLESVLGAFLSHLDAMNVTVDCRFTLGRVLLCFFAHACAPPRGHRRPGVHTCSLIGRCVDTSTTMLTWLSEVRCQLPLAATNCSVLLASAVQQVFHWLQCSVCTGYVFCGTLVFSVL